jgi:hypothetical protein
MRIRSAHGITIASSTQNYADQAVNLSSEPCGGGLLAFTHILLPTTPYKANLISARFRGYAKSPGGGLGAAPVAGEPIELSDILKVAALEISAEL